MSAAATAEVIVAIFMIHTNAGLSGRCASPRIASGSKIPTAMLSQTTNRRIFALRRRLTTAVSPLSANISKKSACGLGTATGRGFAGTFGAKAGRGAFAIGAGGGCGGRETFVTGIGGA